MTVCPICATTISHEHPQSCTNALCGWEFRYFLTYDETTQANEQQRQEEAKERYALTQKALKQPDELISNVVNSRPTIRYTLQPQATLLDSIVERTMRKSPKQRFYTLHIERVDEGGVDIPAFVLVADHRRMPSSATGATILYASNVALSGQRFVTLRVEIPDGLFFRLFLQEPGEIVLFHPDNKFLYSGD